MTRSRQLKTLAALTSVCFLFVLSILADRLVALAVPAIPVQVAHPPNFQEHRRTIEFSVDFRTNSQGLRYREIPLTKQSDAEFRVVVLGDSVTEGWGVEGEQTFSAVLETLFSNARRTFYFINCGLAGTGPMEYGRMLASVGLKYHPDLVLMALHTNDLSDTPEGADLNLVRNWRGQYEVQGPKSLWIPSRWVNKTAYVLWPWSYARLQNLTLERAKLEVKQLGFVDRVTEIARRSGVADSQVRAWREKIPKKIVDACDRNEFDPAKAMMGCLYPDRAIEELDVRGDAAERSWAGMQHVLAQIADLSRTEAIPLAVLYTPTAFQYDDTIGNLRKTTGVRVRREWLTEDSSELERRIRGWAQASGLPYFSLTETFREASRKDPGRFNFPLDEHWTVEGHKVAAHAIAAWLTGRGLVQSPPAEAARDH